MLKLGKMYTAENEYNIFILKNASIDRLEIGDSESKWHNIDSRILYGEYTRKVFRTYGNSALGNLFKDTVKSAKNINVPEQINMRWEDGIFFKDYLMYLSDDELYEFTEKDGVLYNEIFLYCGVKIVLYVFDATCCYDLEPLNFPMYKRTKRLDIIVKALPSKKHSKAYENCLYMTSIFKEYFINLVNSGINIDSPDELRVLLFGDLRLPVLIKEQNGTASVGAEAIQRLAQLKREIPSSIFTNDITDNIGRLALSATQLNNAKYPAAVYLEKYRYYKKLSELHSA